MFIGGVSNEINKNKANAYHAKKYDEERTKEIVEARKRVQEEKLYKEAEIERLQKEAEILRLQKEIEELKKNQTT